MGLDGSGNRSQAAGVAKPVTILIADDWAIRSVIGRRLALGQVQENG